MKCPDCTNGVEVASHVSYADGTHGYNVPLQCFRCRGTAEVPDEMAQWIEDGKRLKRLRMEPVYRSLHEEAKRRGIKALELSRMEMGKCRPVFPEQP